MSDPDRSPATFKVYKNFDWSNQSNIPMGFGDQLNLGNGLDSHFIETIFKVPIKPDGSTWIFSISCG